MCQKKEEPLSSSSGRLPWIMASGLLLLLQPPRVSLWPVQVQALIIRPLSKHWLPNQETFVKREYKLTNSLFTCFSFLDLHPTPAPEIEQPNRAFSKMQHQAKMLLLWHLAEILVFPVTPHYIRWFPPRVSSTWRDHPTPPLPPVCPTVRHWTDCLCAL